MRKLICVLVYAFLVVNIFSAVNYAACNRKSTFTDEEIRIFTPVIYMPGSKEEYLPSEYPFDTLDITSEEYEEDEQPEEYADEDGMAESRTTLSEGKIVRINNYCTSGSNYYNRIRIWDDYTDVYGMDICYKIGDYVYYKDELYVCVMEGRHTGMEPSNSPNVWKPAVPPWTTSSWIGNCR